MKMNAHGNALLMILVAIVLMAALTFAAMETSSETGGDTNPEETKLATTALLQYTAGIKRSFTRLKALENYKWYEIDYGAGNTACTSNRCKLFDDEGGRAQALSEVPERAVGHTNSASALIRFIQVDGVGSDDPELAILIPGLSDEVCKAINREMGVVTTRAMGIPTGYAESGGTGPHDLNLAALDSADLMNTTASTNPADYRIEHVGTGEGAELSGHHTFCYCNVNDANTCNESQPWNIRFWHVLEAR
tara:strand:+ start:1939 stop:2685 length:747 start_codon:yes stop_codon:yes gene_type:complete